MTWFVLGADRTSLRLVLGRDESVLADEVIEVAAKDRAELVLIEDFLERHHLAWSALDRIGGLIVPHSHTSVRVLTTLLGVWSWWTDRMVVHIETPEITTLDADEIGARLRKED